MNLEIIPSLLVESKKEFEEKLRMVEFDCKTVQLDILDGGLFPNTTWFDAESIGQIKTNVNIELHLMVENPIPIIEDFIKHVPTLTRAIVHAEMHRPLGTVTSYIKDVLKLEVGVAINPETPLSQIENVIHSIDSLLIMGVHPGFSGQEFVGESIIKKIKQAKAHREDLSLEIDGGVTEELVKPLVKAGINQICAASLLFKSDDPKNKLRELNQLLKDLV
jgi:ribulose-phosphate 3-epimerase